jgi:hypothetical protein
MSIEPPGAGAATKCGGLTRSCTFFFFTAFVLYHGLLVWTFAWAMTSIMAIWNLCFTGIGFIISFNSFEHIRSRVDSLLLQTTFLDVNLSGCGHGSSMRGRLLNLRKTIKTHQTVPWNRR